MNTPLIEDALSLVRRAHAGDSSGHDFWHVVRVWKMALRIAEAEGAERHVVELAALLHDLDDWKFHDDPGGLPVKAIAWLKSRDVDAGTLDHVVEIISNISFKGANVENRISTLEGRVVQDADRLDAIGAIGIGRAFAFGGSRSRAMYDPEIPPQLHDTFEQYRTGGGHTINHFYEKLLLLKDRMNTASGRQIAKARHQFMQEFVSRFLLEWDAADDEMISR